MSQKVALKGLVLMVGLILCGSFYPFEYDPPASGLGPLGALFQSWNRRVPRIDFVLNIAFYAPFGALGVLAMPASATRGRRLALMLGLGLSFSLANEVMQYYVGRQQSFSDVFANGFGTFLGGFSVLYLGFERHLARFISTLTGAN